MKNLKLYIVSLGVVFFMSFNASAQVGIGTTTPDASSMLDIQSNVKGILIPRMLTSERNAISSPANGLMVFDTETKSFWFYNINVWKELVSDSSLVDADGDTKVEVEKNADEDIIRFSAAGTEYVQINPNGDIKLGNKGASTLTGGAAGGLESDNINEENYTKITADGSLSYVGNATRWDDLKVPVNAVKINKTVDPPSWGSFLGDLALLWFRSGKSDDVVFNIQMPHGWKEGSKIYPHVHWTTKDVAPGTNRVTWVLDYTWQKVGGTFTSNTPISGTAVATPNEGSIENYEHIITPIGTGGIDGTGMTLSSMLVCRLSRSASDSYSGDAGLLEIDFHYQIDSDGSNQEYTKE
ncbi:hypothetical protein EC396_17015 [Lutibacter sp. HS1-25]|uniref:hypothetical protein n=1 Tax=Lutibacter sp. HS1-25 TaxID=2485000 RepID=UPI0010124E55|nr:hypothetical protein [Lutibacter sp. HS1-25]RXP44459.1 hypothetical protein EC396_17015 [Lutibacter sp. HS1-25]